MPVDLLSYRGDANLGFGSNADIAPSANIDLAAIQETSRTIMLLDNQRNMAMFKQKVDDRDNLNAAILNDQVAVGDILPEYQPVFDEAKKKTEDAFFKWKGDFNNTKGFQDYKKSVQDLKDVATRAQVNTVEIKKQEGDKAKQTLKREIEARDKHLKDVRKQDFWDDVTPYQNFNNFKMGSITDDVIPQKTTTRDKDNPLLVYEDTSYDYDDVLRRKTANYLDGDEKSADMDTFATELQALNTPDLIKAVDAVNGQIVKYNEAKGFGKEHPKYLKGIQTEMVDVDGTPRLVIQDSKIETVAKYALSQMPKYSDRTQSYDDKMAKDLNAKALIGLKGKALQIDYMKGRAYAAKQYAEANKAGSQVPAPTNIEEMKQNFISNFKISGIAITERDWVKGQKFDRKTKLPIPNSGTQMKGRGKIGTLPVVMLGDVPKGYQLISGTSLDKNGNSIPARLTPLVGKDGKEYYIVKPRNPLTGEAIDFNKLPPEMQEGFEISNRRSGISKEDYLKYLMRRGDIHMDLQGKDGTAPYSAWREAARATNVRAATKGEEQIRGGNSTDGAIPATTDPGNLPE